MTATLTLHHLRDSRSHRVIWLLEELGLPYELIIYERDPATMLAPEALRQIHPLGKSPVIVDGNLTIAESGAIIEYLLDKYYNAANEGAEGSTTESLTHPRPGTAERLRFTYWLHFAEGSAMPPLLLKLVITKIQSAKMPFIFRPVASMITHRVSELLINPNLERNLDFMEAELAETRWFCGEDFTAADIQMSFPIEVSMERAGLKENPGRWPCLHKFVQEIQNRPAYQRALEKEGSYKYAE